MNDGKVVKNMSTEVKNISAEAFQKVTEVKIESTEAFQISTEVKIERAEVKMGCCGRAQNSLEMNHMQSHMATSTDSAGRYAKRPPPMHDKMLEKRCG